MEVSEIQLYNTLKGKLGDQETQDFISYMKSTVKNEFMDREEKFLTKDDKTEIMMLMKQDKVELISAMKADKIELIRAMKEDKIELIRAMKEDKIELIGMMKKDKMDLIRAIYIAGVVNFIAIVGALLGVVAFILNTLKK